MINEKHKQAIIEFVDYIFEEDGSIKNVSITEFARSLKKMALSCNYVLVHHYDRKRSKEETVKRIVSAIDDMHRLGKEPKVRDIAKKIRKNVYNTRNLMIEYNLFDPSTKKITMDNAWELFDGKPKDS